MSKLLAMAVLVIPGALCGSPVAQAQSTGPELRISGFATLGGVRTDTDQAEFNNTVQVDGATRAVHYGIDSKAGVQLDGKLNSVFSGTMQVQSKFNGNGNFRPQAEWFFGKAQVTPDVALRAGRMGTPAYMVSDFLDVNYASTWVRPPLEAYGLMVLTHFDGMDAIAKKTLGPANFTLQVFGGTAGAVFQRFNIKLHETRGVNLMAELDNGWSMRLGTMKGRLTVYDDPEYTGFVQLLGDSGFPEVARQLDARDKAASFSGLGVAYDRGNWVGMAEYTRRRTDSYVADTTGWYGMLGYRIGRFTPYAGLARVRVDDSNIDNNVPKGLDPDLDLLSGSVDSVRIGQFTQQKTQTLGVRWDVRRDTALKVQWDRIQPQGVGLFTRAQPGLGRVNVVSFSVDIVF